jgi:hypothetical protein
MDRIGKAAITMSIFDKLFGSSNSGSKLTPRPGLGLADPHHPARKYIDTAAVIADRRLEVKVVGDRVSIETDESALSDLTGALDLALAEAPNDPDLLTVKAATLRMLQKHDDADGLLDQALKADSHHPEAAAMRKYGDMWNHLLYLPSWSVQSKQVHRLLAEKANRGDILHCVRHSLQPALVILSILERKDLPSPPTRYRWTATLSETPSGPIGAHYLLLEIGGQIRRGEYFLAPSTEILGPSDPPPSLPMRLPGVKTCFIVLAESSGEVIHNFQYDLPASLRPVLGKISRRLNEKTGADFASIAAAANWHMQHFDIEALTIAD